MSYETFVILVQFEHDHSIIIIFLISTYKGISVWMVNKEEIFFFLGGRRRLKFALINWAMGLLAPIQFEHDHSNFFFFLIISTYIEISAWTGL